MAVDNVQYQLNGQRALHVSPDCDALQEERKVLLTDDDSTDDSDISSPSGEQTAKQNRSTLVDSDFQVNEDYARRFQHNKEREELRRLQDKYGILPVSPHKQDRTGMIGGVEVDFSESSSNEDEDEDENGILALGVLDEQVQSTLEAIRKKDPCVYDTNVKFYDNPNEETEGATETTARPEKPLYLGDYHRKNLLEGGAMVGNGDDDDEGGALVTYQQQQVDLKNSLVKEIHATADGFGRQEESDPNADDDFLIKKAAPSHDQTIATDSETRRIFLDVELADKDPETYLSNFMSAKGWVTHDHSKIQPFESDDEEEDRRAEAFEEAYNLRFEDPKASNEKLSSHARDAAAKYSVRKDEINPRKRKRDTERARKDAAKQLRSEEKARLRKLKVADLQAKLEKIKEAAGLKSENVPEGQWSAFLDDIWDDDRWEQEMKKYFGDDYYDKQEVEGGDDYPGSKKKKRMKKPRWKDEIDISDLVPGFEGDNEDQNLPFDLLDTDVEAERTSQMFKPSKRTMPKAEQDRRKESHRERRKIERLVDEQLGVDETLANLGKKHEGNFRYRETSPLTHGLAAHDILLADDSQLNQFAGLKKLAAFREPDKKRKDKKFLGKKQRLKQWRKETFGNENGPTKTLAEALAGQQLEDARQPIGRFEDGGMREGKVKRKRLRKTKESKAAA